MSLEVQKTHGNCCGHRSLGNLLCVMSEGDNRGKICIERRVPNSYEYKYSYVDLVAHLRKRKAFDRDYTGTTERGCAGYSWIVPSNSGYEDSAVALADEFRKHHYTIKLVDMGRNPKSGAVLTMYVATRTAQSDF